MENAAEALKIAAWVLIFIVALSIGINSVNQTRQTMDTILAYNDKEYEYTYVEESESTEREVGLESILPTIYKAYTENYKIIFPADYTLYTKKIDGEVKNINYIDLEKESLGNNTDLKELFIEAILYGKEGKEDKLTKRFPNITFPPKENALYTKLDKQEKLKEKLGVYYQEETENAEQSSTLDANKTKKRVITYEKKVNN